MRTSRGNYPGRYIHADVQGTCQTDDRGTSTTNDDSDGRDLRALAGAMQEQEYADGHHAHHPGQVP